jgi:hypothetical protein
MHIMKFDDRPMPARRLQEAREKAGFASAKAAATRFGWSPDSYHQHENGQRGITRVAAKYAKAFKVSEAWLLTGDGQGPGARKSFDRSLEEIRLQSPDMADLIADGFERQIESAREKLGLTESGTRKKQ